MEKQVQTEHIEALNFWNKMCTLKRDILLYEAFFSRSVLIARLIRVGTAILTALATGIWMNWNDVSWISQVCSIVIVFLPAICAGAELLPYESRKLDLREAIALLNPVYLEMESVWHSISRSEIVGKQIDDQTQVFQNRINEIKNGFLKHDSLPRNEKIENKANTEADEYLKNFK